MLLSNKWQVHKNNITDKWQILDECLFVCCCFIARAGVVSLLHTVFQTLLSHTHTQWVLGWNMSISRDKEPTELIILCGNVFPYPRLSESSFVFAESMCITWHVVNPTAVCVFCTLSSWPVLATETLRPQGMITHYWSWSCSVFWVKCCSIQWLILLFSLVTWYQDAVARRSRFLPWDW